MSDTRELTQDEAIAILKGGFGKALFETAFKYVAPMTWSPPPPADSQAKINNGSIFFLECGGPPLGITAAHVYTAYHERKTREPDLICQIADVRFDPEARLIDIDEDLDIVTFRVEPGQIERVGKWLHRHPYQKWPPRPPEVGKGAFFAGYPGEDRVLQNSRTINFGVASMLATVTTVGELRIVCHFERENWIQIGYPLPTGKLSMGGMSGAPLWALTQNAAFAWRLGGIITEFNEEFDLLYATRPDFVSREGILIRP